MRKMDEVRNSRSSGMTLVEALATMALVGVLLGVGALYLTRMEGGLDNAINMTQGFLRQSRASAVATSKAHRVRPAEPGRIIVETDDTCSSGSWVIDSGMEIELPHGVTLVDTDWGVCFDTRGMTRNNVTIELFHAGGFGTKSLQVLLGGTTRVVE